MMNSTYEHPGKTKSIMEYSEQATNSLSGISVTFSEAAEMWLHSKKETVKKSTYIHYSLILEKRLLPRFGSTHFNELTSEDIDRFLLRLLESGGDDANGLSEKTVIDIRSVLLQVIRYTEYMGIANRITRPVYCPRLPNRQISVLTKAEQQKLERVILEKPSDDGLAILLALYAGLRIGEICALQWKDYHPSEGTIEIRKTLIRLQEPSADSKTKTSITVNAPKTYHSMRLIPLPAFLAEIMTAHIGRGEYYIATGSARFAEPRLLLYRYKKYLSRAGLPSFTFHAMRHTFATRCVENGFDIKSLSEILGHANVSTTLQLYVHPSMEMKREQMNRLNGISEIHKYLETVTDGASDVLPSGRAAEKPPYERT